MRKSCIKAAFRSDCGCADILPAACAYNTVRRAAETSVAQKTLGMPERDRR